MLFLNCYLTQAVSVFVEILTDHTLDLTVAFDLPTPFCKMELSPGCRLFSLLVSDAFHPFDQLRDLVACCMLSLSSSLFLSVSGPLSSFFGPCSRPEVSLPPTLW